MKCNFIGAGRLGKNIALALSSAGIASVHSVCNRTLTSAINACHEIGSGLAVESLDQLPEADITWVTCNDDSIQLIVDTLTGNSKLKPESLVIHCSGVLNSSILSPLKSLNCSIASFHPLKAFKTGYLSTDAFHNVDCVLEGDGKVCAWIYQAFTSLGANIITIKPEAKATYHAAACMASNYLITLAACSEELLLNAGITQEQARRMICNLMQGNINNLKETTNISESLTGPLMRGDNKTLSLHLQAIENPTIKELYKAAGLATLPLAQLDKSKKQVIKRILLGWTKER